MTPRVRLYAEQAASDHRVTADAILSASARRPVARARGDVMRRLRADGFTVTQIGRWLGRDHSTVSHWTHG